MTDQWECVAEEREDEGGAGNTFFLVQVRDLFQEEEEHQKGKEVRGKRGERD